MNLRPVRVVLDTTVDPTPERQHALLSALLEEGFAVTTPGDRASRGNATVAPLDTSPLLVLTDHDGAQHHDDPSAGVAVAWRDIRGLETEAVVELARAQVASGDGGVAETQDTEIPMWKPWFPVIDYDRCTNCMQCLSFCLFGVYDVDSEQTIDVAHPEKCKTNCPACSRVCPEVAILFPKYKNGPINGDEVKGEDVDREKMKTDISSLLGGDIYALLRQRHARATSRFSKERDEERALKERQRCLTKLQQQFDIPDEVLQELPTAEAIQAKAAERISQHDGADSPAPTQAPNPRRSS